MTALAAPEPGLRACVVVPAHDEADLIVGCLRALATQDGVDPAAYEVILVLDACTDATARALRRAAKTSRHCGCIAARDPAAAPGRRGSWGWTSRPPDCSRSVAATV